MDGIHSIAPRKVSHISRLERNATIEDSTFLILTNQSTDTFYKDEGGRQAHIQIDLKIKTPKSNPLNVRHVPIQATLLYENGYQVHNQEILSIVPSPSHQLETDDNGNAAMRFRIEEVSKNHRSQRFVVKISTDNPNIVPVKTDPILVLSKRKDRKRRVETAGMPWSSDGIISRSIPGFHPSPTHDQEEVEYAKMFLPRHLSMPPRSSCLPAPVREPRLIGNTHIPPTTLPIPELGPLGQEAVSMLVEAEWHVIGQSINAHTGKADPDQPILQCFECSTISMGGHKSHAANCRLRNLLDKCDRALNHQHQSIVQPPFPFESIRHSFQKNEFLPQPSPRKFVSMSNARDSLQHERPSVPVNFANSDRIGAILRASRTSMNVRGMKSKNQSINDRERYPSDSE